METEHKNRKPNRLINEKSPYLLQHAYNPVDWNPWGDEAFKRAAEQDKPIFLSIGYSTCHWCHVMERESFEDPEVAALMNDSFINIKVDREERPDLDAVYMNACQLLHGQGGWPLTIIMTPDKEPFYAATYLPKQSMMGRIGMMDLAPRIKELWQNERDKILTVAGQVVDELSRVSCECGAEPPSETTLSQAYQQLASIYDPENGGFGQRPKFPTPHNLIFLLRYYSRTGQRTPLEMATKTLDAMRNGGIYDHIGFGFHRYSTDPHWLVPHFEKMLYDQALLALAYTEAYQATGEQKYRQTVDEIFAYLLRDMASPEGAFYSAEDADSEGVEGKFYLWSEDEVREVLGEDDARLISTVFSTRADGNFLEESTQDKTGTNILHLAGPLSEAAAKLGLSKEELAQRVEAARKKLLDHRAKRIRPHLDDKILADWNGLAIAALARAAAAMGEPRYADHARKALHFIMTRMTDARGGLLHRYRDGEAAIPAFLDDYAFLIWALIELYQADFDPAHLADARELAGVVIRDFRDEERGGFFMSGSDSERTIARQREAYDGALPSGNSVMAMNLLRLSRLLGDPELERAGAEVLRAFYCDVRKAPAGYTHMLAALGFALGPTSEIVIAGQRDAEDSEALLKKLREIYAPDKVVLFKHGDNEREIAELAEYTADLSPVDGKAAAYVCRNFNCELPLTDPEKMKALLAAPA